MLYSTFSYNRYVIKTDSTSSTISRYKLNTGNYIDHCNIIQSTYTIHIHNLKTTNSAKCLGIHIHITLNWKTHINKTAQRANTTSTFLHRNIRTCLRNTKHLAYTALVRPILEYASIIWDPHTDSSITNLKQYNAAQPDASCTTTIDMPASQPCSSTLTYLHYNKKHHAIQKQTPTSQHANHHLYHTSHSEYSTLHPAICPHIYMCSNRLSSQAPSIYGTTYNMP